MDGDDEEYQRIVARRKLVVEQCANARSAAPVGKKIICERQRRQLFGLPADDSMLDSTSSSQKDESEPLSSQSSSPLRSRDTNIEPLSSVEKRRRDGIEKCRQHVQLHEQAERDLGGAHNVFEDTAPEFQPTHNLTVEEDSMVSQESSQIGSMGDGVDRMETSQMSTSQNLARSPALAGSQGFGTGHASSTPRNLNNHTFAPFRQLDVSAVVRLDISAEEAQRQADLLSKKLSDPPTGRLNDSLGDVMGKLRGRPIVGKVVPKSGPTDCTSSLQTVDEGKTTTSQPFTVENGTTSRQEKTGDTFTIDKGRDSNSDAVANGTFVIGEAPQAVSSEAKSSTTKPSGETFTIDNGNGSSGSLVKNGTFVVDAAGKRSVTRDGDSEVKVAASDTFVVPVEPKRRSLNKRERDERNATKRNVSGRRNNTLLEDMEMDVESPGRKLFVARPAKRARDVPKTPGNGRIVADRKSTASNANLSIAFQNVSGAHSSVVVDDDSMVDPVTDPQTASSPNGLSLPHEGPMGPATSVDGAHVPSPPPAGSGDEQPTTPVGNQSVDMSTTTPLRAPGSGRTSRSSLCRSHAAASNVSTPVPLAGYAKPTCSSLRKRVGWDSTAADVSMNESLPPFQSIDPSRMLTDAPMQSGVRPRLPDSRVIVQNRFRKTSLFDDAKTPVDFEASRRNLLGRSRLESSSAVANAASSREPVSINRMSSDGSTDDDDVLSQATSKLSIEETGSKLANVESGDDEVFLAQGDLPGSSRTFVNAENNQQRELLSSSIWSVDTPHRDGQHFQYPQSVTSEVDMSTADLDSMVDVSSASSQFSMSPVHESPKVVILKPRKIIKPETPVGDEANLRRSTRNRMQPVRQWLGEKAVYQRSPTTGCGRLVGTNEVSVTDRAMIRARNADSRVVVDEQLRHQAFMRRQRQDKKYRRRGYQSESDSD